MFDGWTIISGNILWVAQKKKLIIIIVKRTDKGLTFIYYDSIYSWTHFHLQEIWKQQISCVLKTPAMS